jgi:hypothetical protein
MTIPEAPREDGWYRVAGHVWIPVTDEAAQAEIDAGGGWDLVRVNSVMPGYEETPLF